MARTKAFFTDTVDALATAHDESWDAARTDAELTRVQRAHGYWTDTPVLGGRVRRGVAGIVAALTLAACSGASAADKAWEEAELPMPIFMVRININAESDMLGAVMRAAAEDIGRCCFFANNEFHSALMHLRAVP